MILVTGGTGFFGSHLLRKLVAEKQPVKAICRSNSNFDLVKDIKHLIEWHHADVLDLTALDAAFENVDEVYHAAATISFRQKEQVQMMQINVDGTSNLVNLALQHQIKKFAFISSVATLGRSDTANFISEKTEWQDSKYNTKYALSKMLAEREVWRANAEGLNTVIVNPCIMLGVGNWQEGSTAFFKNIYEGLKFYTNGINAFVDVKDAVNITCELMQKNVFNERFTIAEGNYSYHEIFSLIAKHLNCAAPQIEVGEWLSAIGWRVEFLKELFTGKKSLITRETVTTANLKCYYANDKIKNQLQYQFTPIEQTIEETAKSYLASLL